SSSATRQLPSGTAPSISFASARIASDAGFPSTRVTAFSGTSSKFHSRGIRFAYSSHPASIQAGSRVPTAITRTRIVSRRDGVSAIVPAVRARLADAALARGRRGPQLLELVVRADRRLHDMDDDVAAVDEHPLGVLLAL